jgi:uncharacterized protein involved in response to NO
MQAVMTWTGTEGIAPRFLNLLTGLDEWLDSRSGRLIQTEEHPAKV